MRSSPVALAAAVLAAIVTFAAPAAPDVHAAGSAVKVAIIVGAVHGATAGYRSNADEVYREAIKYSSNVVRVYSPNATAARVRNAVAGASIVVYMGHGNGWPSPYTFDPSYTTKDGFGLNADVNGDGRLSDYENKYYGEPWIRDLRPAPNAVVLLFHLCYASGNSEPGNPDPTLSVAKKRVDNYGAGFLRAGFRAVVAIGHNHGPYYIDGLFTTRQTIDEYFRNAPDAHDNVTTYASSRTPGYQFEMDPDRPGAYYRSVVGKLSLRTQDVTGAPFADTSADPATMQVPGNASPSVDGTPMFGSVESAVAGTDPIATLGTDVHVRVDAKEATPSADGSPVYRVHTDAVAGWMTGSGLVPRDGTAPRVWDVDDGAGTFSPNGDGVQDAYALTVELSEPSDWTVKLRDAGGHVVKTFTGSGQTVDADWTPAPGSAADGVYRWGLDATDAWGNGPLSDYGDFTLDTRAPDLSLADAVGAVPQFSPNGDGLADTVRFAATTSEPGSVTGTVLDAGDAVVDVVSAGVTASGTLGWDGKTAGGTWAPDGTYTIAIRAVDRAGNRSDPQVRTVTAYGALGYVAANRAVFFPQDGDALGGTVGLTFRLRSAATVGWTIRNASGDVVRTILAGAELAAGTQSFSWNGRTDVGVLVPRGTFRSVVTATDGTFTATQAVAVVADAFRITASDVTPARGQKLTITATSAEGLDTTPGLHVYQPGISGWSVAMKKVDSRTWRITVTLKGSAAGTLRLRVSARDANGASQSSTLALPLH